MTTPAAQILSELPSIPYTAHRTLPRIPAVYLFLAADGSVLYIGSSWNVRERCMRHHTRPSFPLEERQSIAWFACNIEQLQHIEQELLRMFPSRYNKDAVARRRQHLIIRTTRCANPDCQQPFLTDGHEKYCSQACYFAVRPSLIECVCKQCGTEFIRKPVDIRKGGGVYCSKACMTIGMRGEHKVEYTCQHCGKMFLRWPSQRRGGVPYCSSKCGTKYIQGTPIERFWRNVLRCEHLDPCRTCCWLWQGTTMQHGYGQMIIDGRKRLTHRLSWEWFYQRPLDTHTLVRHLCHTPSCVNPAHLAIGTQQDNMNDSAKDGRIARGERHTLAKLTDEKVHTIRLLRAQGMTQQAIADAFGVCREVIRDIVHRRTWKHVP